MKLVEVSSNTVGDYWVQRWFWFYTIPKAHNSAFLVVCIQCWLMECVSVSWISVVATERWVLTSTSCQSLSGKPSWLEHQLNLKLPAMKSHFDYRPQASNLAVGPTAEWWWWWCHLGLHQIFTNILIFCNVASHQAIMYHLSDWGMIPFSESYWTWEWHWDPRSHSHFWLYRTFLV